MHHHPIFQAFSRVSTVATGRHVYDFLGGITDVSYKKGWAQHAPRAGARIAPDYPVVNEHYFDWIATLESVRAARGTFRMAELGAGWAPWLVRAALAARQCPAIVRTELVAVEADATHFDWVRAHFRDNGLVSPDFHFLHGAMAALPGMVRFPKIAHPDEDYGASTRAVTARSEYVEVAAFSMADVIDRLSGPIDFLHMDVQGAEYDVLPPAMDLVGHRVRAIMIGTHISGDRHDELARSFRQRGWKEVMNFPRNGHCSTTYGDVQFGDGFLYYRNPSLPLPSG